MGLHAYEFVSLSTSVTQSLPSTAQGYLVPCWCKSRTGAGQNGHDTHRHVWRGLPGALAGGLLGLVPRPAVHRARHHAAPAHATAAALIPPAAACAHGPPKTRPQMTWDSFRKVCNALGRTLSCVSWPAPCKTQRADRPRGACLLRKVVSIGGCSTRSSFVIISAPMH